MASGSLAIERKGLQLAELIEWSKWHQQWLHMQLPRYAFISSLSWIAPHSIQFRHTLLCHHARNGVPKMGNLFYRISIRLSWSFSTMRRTSGLLTHWHGGMCALSIVPALSSTDFWLNVDKFFQTNSLWKTKARTGTTLILIVPNQKPSLLIWNVQKNTIKHLVHDAFTCKLWLDVIKVTILTLYMSKYCMMLAASLYAIGALPTLHSIAFFTMDFHD